MDDGFHGWPADGPAVLAAIAADNTWDNWAALRERHATEVLAPMRALAAALEGEFGPVRVFRPYVNRRFRPAAPPLRTDTGAVVTTAGGCTLGVVLSGVALSVTAGCWSFDGPQLRRYRAAVDGSPGEELVTSLDGFTVDPARTLTGTPRGWSADHPRIGLLRQRGLQVGCTWELGPWVQTAEPLTRVRAAWRAAGPLNRWLDEHVGPPDPVPPRPRPAAGPAATGPGGDPVGAAAEAVLSSGAAG